MGRRYRLRAATLVSLAALAACDDVSGLSDFVPAQQGAGGSSTSAATGGHGGQGGGVGGMSVGGGGQGGQPSTGGFGGAGGAGGEAGAGGRGGGGAGPPLCAFADDFDDGVVGSLWNANEPGDIVVSEDGELVIGMRGGNGLQAGWVLTDPFDATTCEVAVALIEDAPPAGTFVHFELYLDAQNRVGFLIKDDELRLVHEIGGVQAPEYLVLSETPHQYLKIAHGPAGFVWSTSADGTTWTEQRTLASALPVTGMRVIVGTEILPATLGAPAYEARFDDLKAAMP